MPAAASHRPILGRLVALLGGIGVVLCVVVWIAIWMIGARVNRATADGVDHLERGLTGWVEAAVDTQAGIERTRGVVRELEARLQERIAEALTPSAEAEARLAELEGQLRAGVQQAHHWLDTADAVMTVVEQMLKSLEASGLLFHRRPEAYRQLLGTLSDGRETITRLDQGIRELSEQISALRDGRQSGPGLPQISRLSDQIDTSLVSLDKYAETFQAAVRRVVEAAEELRSRLQFRLLLVQLGLSALLAWQAAAQASLLELGRRGYRSGTTT